MVLSMTRWVGKVAVVTGAASGIGAAVTDQLVENGLTVAGIDINPEQLEAKAKQTSGKKGKLYSIKADVSKEEEILKAFEWVERNLGTVHVLINCAGIWLDMSLIEGDTEGWRRVLDVNVIGVCICSREAIKMMRNNDIDGHVITINSISGHKVPLHPGLNVYPASKFAITAIVETLRQELNSLGSKIKVTSISPGLVNTPLIGPKVKFIKAILNPGDIADGIIYALSTPEHVQVHELTIKPIGELH